MKQYIIVILLIQSLICLAQGEDNFTASDMLKSMNTDDKAAILMVYFGSTHDDTRALTIEPLNRKVKDIYRDIEVREAFTSRMVIRSLKAKGVEKLNPVEVLEKLNTDGFTHIIVQSTNIIEGAEMEVLRREVAGMAGLFKDIRIGNPLLYSPDDYKAVIEALIPAGNSHDAVNADGNYSTAKMGKNHDTPKADYQPPYDATTVWVGHGTYTPATAQYAMLDYMLKAKGYKNYFVATVEGYPSLEEVIAELEKSGAKKIVLRPFLFVAGDHAKNDIAGDMKGALEDKGYQVEVLMEGLGQDENIQNIFIDHIRFSLSHKVTDIIEKKKTL